MRAFTVIVGGILAGIASIVLIAYLDNPDGFERDPFAAILRPFESRVMICGKSGRAEADVQMLSTLMPLFEAWNKRLPTNSEGLQVLVTKPVDADLPKWRQIMPEMPLDPWNRPYQYRSPALRSKEAFEIYSLGPDGVMSADDVGPW